MENGQDNDLLGLGNVEDRIRKATCRNGTNFLVLDRIPIGVVGCKFD